MLCVVLGCNTSDELLAEHRRLVEQGARLVEWRLDYLTEPFDVATMLVHRPGPVVVTVRLPADGGRWTGDERQRQEIFRSAIAAGAEYIDLEEVAATTVPRLGTTKRIVSYHDFERTPDDLGAFHARLASAGADVVKLATMATCVHDGFRMLDVVASARIPTVGFCMGELGTPTRILALRSGAPWTYAALDGEAPLAPGQLGYHAMRDLYRAESICRETAVYGVIGDPIAHSLSPKIHNAALAHVGRSAVYVPFRVPPIELSTFLDDVIRLGCGGLSVTIPHKEAVRERITSADAAVGEIGAANTLVFPDGEVRAYNTDRSAAIDSLAETLGRDRFDGLRALVLGAGGAAKAIVHGLVHCGAQVTVTSRTRERAAALAGSLACDVVAWDDRHTIAADVLVNCTPIGMSPKVDETPYEAARLQRTMIVFDTVYNPERTTLLRDAAAVGCRTITGIEMFVRQGAQQFELFTGQPAPLEVMRRAITNARPRSIVLIGYRGTGKTAVAACLARRLGWEAIDADALVEERAGKSIAAIFQASGEQAFRDLESEVIGELVERTEVVIATGGGVVLREQNRRAIACAGQVVWLRADVPTILERVAADPTTAARRPNLTVDGGEPEVRRLLTEREPLYYQCAEITVDTDHKSPDAIAEEIRTVLAGNERE